jgi:hypothetical protein
LSFFCCYCLLFRLEGLQWFFLLNDLVWC